MCNHHHLWSHYRHYVISSNFLFNFSCYSLYNSSLVQPANGNAIDEVLKTVKLILLVCISAKNQFFVTSQRLTNLYQIAIIFVITKNDY